MSILHLFQQYATTKFFYVSELAKEALLGKVNEVPGLPSAVGLP